METTRLYTAIRALKQAREWFTKGTKSPSGEAKAAERSSKEIKKAAAREKLFTREDAAKLSKESHGQVTIPTGKEVVCRKAFDGDSTLRSISVPGSVKRIEARAFAECVNLEKVELAEGIETIDDNVFSGCTGLTRLTIPDSVRGLYGWTFYQFTGLRTPVYNRSGTILYCYPCTAEDKMFIVPEHVEQVNAAAFLRNPWLEEVVLPPKMEVLGSRSFMECGIRRITIQKSVKRIESEALYSCKSLEKVAVLGKDTSICDGAFYNCPFQMEIVTSRMPRYDERLHWFGAAFLYGACKTLPGGGHCGDRLFRHHAKGCAEGDVRAMWELGNYFANLGGHEFYTYAANFWRYRAVRRGFAPAKKWLEQWIKENPGQRLPSVSAEVISGSVDGRMMRYAGFLSFNVNRTYNVMPPDENGIVVINSWCGDDGPDEDGFGREEFYDWWFLDKNLRQIPGTTMVRSHSYRDRRYSPKYKSQYDKAVSVLSGE